MMKLYLFLVRKLNKYMFIDIFYMRVSNSSHHPLIQAAQDSRPAKFGGSQAKQGRTVAPSVLVGFFWNFGFKILKY